MLAEKKWILFLLIIFLANENILAQEDSLLIPVLHVKKDTVLTFNPKKAIIRSAIIPGWGQITNKKIWKVPLVYGALGTTAFLFRRNIIQYRESKSAYILATDNDPSNDDQIKQPYYSVKDQPERIKEFRNAVRQNVDYCVVFFVLVWGLNVADAAVDAHLKSFDVTDDLSIQFKAGYSPMARTNGLSLVMTIK